MCPTRRLTPSIALAAGLALGCTGCGGRAQTEQPNERASDLELAVDQYAGTMVERGEVAGLSVAVRRDGALVFAKGYGLADIENDVAATADTV